MTTNHFCGFISLKVAAFIMAFAHLLGGVSVFIGGVVGLQHVEVEGDITFYVFCVIIGIESFFTGGLLTVGIVQGRDKYILLYLLLGFVNLFTVTIYSGINMFANQLYIPVFLLCLYLWYCQLSTYYFYEEVLEYNTVKSGAIEISYNDKGYTNTAVLNDSSFDNTAV